MARRKSGDEVLTAPVRGRPAGAGFTLNVLGDTLFATHALPLAGEALIGRSSDAAISIDDPSISRRHALIRTGERLTIEDLGSVNGTRVGGQRLVPGEPRVVMPGEAIEVGVVPVVVVVSARAPSERPRRLVSHDFFEARLEEECARADRGPLVFSVLRLSAAHDAAGVDDRPLHAALAATLGPEQPIGVYGPGEYEALLVGVDVDEAARLRDALAARAVASALGLASYPRDGRTPEALMAHACRQLRVGYRRRPASEDPAAAPESAASINPASVVVRDPAMLALHELAARAAAGTISVLLLGETGCGKEILADTIHNRSPRRDKPFLRLNCAALAESLLESELFGHEKGSFSGATQTKPGLLETADGGTVFLDEVGEMPLSLQAKLLRVIEERRVTRVGGLKARAIDVRFVSATNRDLEAESALGTFRADLYYRLNGMTLSIPPLRERPSEIESLAQLFLTRAASELGRPVPALAADALTQLKRYIWPGNIRELRNMMERAALLCAGSEVTLAELPLEKLSAGFTRPAPPSPSPTPSIDDALSGDDERARIMAALERCAGNQTHAARLLGISRGTLVSRLAEYKLPRPRKRTS
ncbi:MAG TPA: sigma 54-interacting transcriptional regulator [Polyangia bacterium]|jgi:DNA-binding NtrC family response regulator|nr:sigma 54-interacting transcriptional regulator [Polyangia bacterium]